MGLTGGFHETSFQDLTQLYAASRWTVALEIYLRDGSAGPDGLFHFENGDLVGAVLSGVTGRTAIRQALRLTSGRFRARAVARSGLPERRESLRLVLMEEVVKLDEERQRQRGQGQVPVAGAALPPEQRPRRESAPVAATRSAAATDLDRPVPPPPRRGRTATLLATVAAGLIVAGLAAWRLRAAPPAAQRNATAPVVRGELVLGMTASLTGANREGGRAMKLGWETALAAANARGGIHGRTLRLVAMDDAYDPEKTAAALGELLEKQRVFAVVGSVGTANAAVAAPYCGQRHVVFYGPMSGADFLRRSPPDRYVFTVRASLAEEAAAAVRHLVTAKRVPAHRIAVLVQNDGFGESGWRGAAEELEARGARRGEILRLEYARNTADVRDALEKLAAARDVQAVVLVATYKPAATFIRKARDLGRPLQFVSVSPDSNALAQELVAAGAGATEDVVVTQVVPLPTSNATGVRRYRADLDAHAPGEPPGSTTLEGWIGAQGFLAALEKAGPDPDAERLVQALESVEHLDLGTGAPLSFDARSHQASHKVWGWALQQDGTYRAIELE